MHCEKNLNTVKKHLKSFEQLIKKENKMKRYLFAAALACTFGVSYAQKAELAEAQKALDKKDYASALSYVGKADAIIKQNESSVPAEQKAQAMYIKGIVALAQAGNNTEAAADAIKQLAEVVKFESAKDYSARNNETKKNETFASQADLDKAMISGKYSKPKVADRVATYTPAIKQALNTAGADLYQKAVDAFNAKKYEDAAKLFDVTYLAQEQYAPKADTALYNNAAISMLQAHKYDEAAEYYKKLIDMGYTGIETVYEATDVLSGKRQIYPSKKDLDTQVKLKLATDPTTRVEPSKEPEIYLTFIQILFQQEKWADVVEYARKARAKFPQDKNYLMIEGQVYYDNKQFDKYLELLKEGEKLYPEDADIQYNMGYIYSELKDKDNAKLHYEKALEKDPKYANAYINLASMVLDKEQQINEEIDKLPYTLNAAQKKQYDQLRAQKDEIYKEAVKVLERGYQNVPDNTVIVQTLRNLYNNLGDEANAKKFSDLTKSLLGE